MSRPVNRRRQFFIKKEFQGKFILLYALGITALAGLATFAVYRTVQRVLEYHLYSSHLRIGRTGDLLLGLLMKTNILAVFAIVAVVIALSMVIFSRLNLHFRRMEQRLEAIGRGDFTTPTPPPSRFNEISRLIGLVQQTHDDHRQRFREIAAALEEIEQGCRDGGDRRRLENGRERLRSILARVSLPEG